jgi:hypothetical protein
MKRPKPVHQLASAQFDAIFPIETKGTVIQSGIDIYILGNHFDASSPSASAHQFLDNRGHMISDCPEIRLARHRFCGYFGNDRSGGCTTRTTRDVRVCVRYGQEETHAPRQLA